MDLDKFYRQSYGTINVLGYSKNNNLIGFKVKLFKPCNTSIAHGIYNCRSGKTYIKVNRNGLKFNKLDIPRDKVIQIINKVLSQQDWDEDVEYTAFHKTPKYKTLPYKGFMTMWKVIKK